MIIEYEHEFQNKDDEYESIVLNCHIGISRAEPDIGIMSDQAEILAIENDEGYDWYNKLSDWDKEQIRLTAINEYVNEKSYKWICQ